MPPFSRAHENEILEETDETGTNVECNKLCPCALKSLGDVQCETEKTYH